MKRGKHMQVRDFHKNSKLADEGVWVDGLLGDLKLKVRPGNSKIVRRAFTEMAMSMEVDTPEAREAVAQKVFAEYVLLDWENVFNGEDEVPYSVELATQWLTNPD